MSRTGGRGRRDPRTGRPLLSLVMCLELGEWQNRTRKLSQEPRGEHVRGLIGEKSMRAGVRPVRRKT